MAAARKDDNANAERPTFGHDTTRAHDSSGHLRPRRVWGRSKRAPLAITPAEIRTPRGVASFPGSHDGGSGGRGSSTALKQCHLLLVGRSEFVQHTQRRHLLVVCTVLWRPLVPIVDIDHSLRTRAAEELLPLRVALSTCEAEIIALSEGAKDTVYFPQAHRRPW